MAEAMDSSGLGDRDSELGPPSSRPTCIVCLGMAGSGKTTFVQVRLMEIAEHS